MGMRAQSFVTLAAMTVGIAACSGKLDEAKAKELLLDSAEFKEPTYCAWNAPRRYSAVDAPPPSGPAQRFTSIVRAQMVPPRSSPRVTTPGVSDTGNFGFADSGKEGKCAAALEAAAIAKRGECVEPGCGGCCKRAITAKGGAHLRGGLSEPGKLEFVCGKTEVVKVTSIVTEERRATVTYVKSVTFDKGLLDRLDAEGCGVDRPMVHSDADQRERSRSGFVRDDGGNWSLR